MRTILLFLAFTLTGLSAHGQDSLLLLNGKTLPGTIDDQNPTHILLKIPAKNDQTKSLRYDRDQIYSYQKSGVDSIVYQHDPMLGYELSQIEMRNFMYGQNDARNGHPMLYNQLGGFAVGLGSSLALDGGALPFLTPVLYSLSMQIPLVKVRDEAVSNRESSMSPYYLEGYNATARSKKFVKGFLSTMAGVVVGSGIVLLTQ